MSEELDGTHGLVSIEDSMSNAKIRLSRFEFAFLVSSFTLSRLSLALYPLLFNLSSVTDTIPYRCSLNTVSNNFDRPTSSSLFLNPLALSQYGGC